MLHRRPPGRQTGFTLLEMLVSLVVLGFLVVGLTQGVRAGLRLWDAQTLRIGETGELDAGARVLRALLSGIWVPPQGGLGRGAPGKTDIEGHADSLAFRGDLPTGLGTTRLANITLELRERRLVLRWSPHRHELTNAPEPEPVETELICRCRAPGSRLLGFAFARSGGGLAGTVGWSCDFRAHPRSPCFCQR